MSFFDGYLISIIFIVFPLFLYFVYIMFFKPKENTFTKAFFEVMLLFTMFLFIRYNNGSDNYYCTILVNVPLILAYLKKRRLSIAFISLILIFYNFVVFKIELYILIFEYAIYVFLYLFGLKNKKESTKLIQLFIIFKTFILSFMTFYIISPNNSLVINLFNILLSVFMFYIITITYYNILVKVEDLLNIDNAIKEFEKEKTIRDMLFKVVHEIKNPIAVCKGYLDMLDSNNKEKTDKYISIVKGEINRTLYIMDDYLDCSKIKIEKDIIDIIMLIEDTVRAMEELLKDKGVRIITDILDSEVYILADYNRLKQVLVNLIKNSIEARIDNCQLDILIKTNIYKDKIEVIVSDNGVGMTKEEIRHLGEMFFTTKCNGTGIGVSLSKEIIDGHGGILEYHSIKYKGTSAIISLPLDSKLQFE